MTFAIHVYILLANKASKMYAWIYLESMSSYQKSNSCQSMLILEAQSSQISSGSDLKQWIGWSIGLFWRSIPSPTRTMLHPIHCFKSDQDEIWLDCFSSISIDWQELGLLIWLHTFEINSCIHPGHLVSQQDEQDVCNMHVL